MSNSDSTNQNRNNGNGPGRIMGNGRGREGRVKGKQYPGNEGQCICLSCGFKMTHGSGMPDFNLSCPKCGSEMVKVWKFHLMGE